MRSAGSHSGYQTCLASLFLLGGLAPSASANVGVPMLAVVWPASWWLLVPVILLESLVAVRLLRVGFVRGARVVGIANLLSTLAGIPITWGILVLVQMLLGWGDARWMPDSLTGALAAVTLQSPWLMPFEEQLRWMVPAAAAVLCVPFFLMSIIAEGPVVGVLLDLDGKDTWRWAWRANGLTYGLIWLFLGISVWRAL